MTIPTSRPAFLWLDGQITPIDKAVISPSDRGFLLGDGLYETFRFSHGKAPHLARHWARLNHGCDMLRLKVPEYCLIEKAFSQLCAANQLDNGSARLTVTRGSGPRGLLPPACPHQTIMLTVNPLSTGEKPSIRITISSYRRDSNSALCRIKSINTLSSVLARLEAREQQADDALFLNERNFIAEATASNFIAMLNGQILTPFIEDGALPGISRQRLIEKGLCTEASLSPAEIPFLEGAWLVSALTLTPINQIGNTRIAVDPERTKAFRRFLY